jgi:hypothetical protein
MDGWISVKVCVYLCLCFGLKAIQWPHLFAPVKIEVNDPLLIAVKKFVLVLNYLSTTP